MYGVCFWLNGMAVAGVWVSVSGICSRFVFSRKLDDGVTGQGRADDGDDDNDDDGDGGDDNDDDGNGGDDNDGVMMV